MRLPLILALLACLPDAASAQFVESAPVDETRPIQQPIGYTPGIAAYERRDVELAVSEEFAWLAYRSPYDFGDGFLTLEVLGNEDESFVARGMITRLSPAIGNPQLSVGLGVYGGYFDIPGDGFVVGVPINVGARYEIPTEIPITLSGSVGWAPDITTFSGGDEILDFEARAEVGISDSAAFFVGYRHLEFEVRGEDVEVGESVVAGVRLWL